MPLDERTPLLQFPGIGSGQTSRYGDLHEQFCKLVGVPPLTLPPGERGKPHPESLYHRAVAHRRNQNAIYLFTATLTNTMLPSQVVLGATLTALGASSSSHILITLFGALNTVIAGLVAWVKSRGQPVRARMFRDDLERVVDEIENSAVMWLGISREVHGYSAIDTDDQVTVRSEVARLTRLYDRAVRTNTMNDPDMYSSGLGADPHSAALRGAKPVPPPSPAAAALAPAPPPSATEPVAAPPAAADPDESPATKAVPNAADTSKDAHAHDDAAVPDKDRAADTTDKAREASSGGGDSAGGPAPSPFDNAPPAPSPSNAPPAPSPSNAPPAPSPSNAPPAPSPPNAPPAPAAAAPAATATGTADDEDGPATASHPPAPHQETPPDGKHSETVNRHGEEDDGKKDSLDPEHGQV